MYTKKRLEWKGEVHSSPLTKKGGFVTSQQLMGDWSASPQLRDLRTRALEREDECVQHVMALQCVDILALCNLRTCIRKNINESQKQKNVSVTNKFSSNEGK